MVNVTFSEVTIEASWKKNYEKKTWIFLSKRAWKNFHDFDETFWNNNFHRKASCCTNFWIIFGCDRHSCMLISRNIGFKFARIKKILELIWKDARSWKFALQKVGCFFKNAGSDCCVFRIGATVWLHASFKFSVFSVNFCCLSALISVKEHDYFSG